MLVEQEISVEKASFVRIFNSLGDVIAEAQRRTELFHYSGAFEVICQAEANNPQFQTPENQEKLLSAALEIEEKRKEWCTAQLEKIETAVKTYQIGDALYQFEELAHIGFPDIISDTRKKELEARFNFPQRIKESREITRVGIITPVEKLNPNVAHPPTKISHLTQPNRPSSVDININHQ
jgi:hypothetical protein